MLIVAFGIFFAGAFTVLVTEPHFRERRVSSRFNNHLQKTFEPIDEPPQVRRVCGYLVGGNSWKK